MKFKKLLSAVWRWARNDPKSALGVLVTVVCIGFLGVRVDWPELGRVLWHAHPWAVGAAVGCQALQLLIRSRRWQLLLQKFGSPRYWSVFQMWMVGLMLNNTLPAKIGEVSKAYLVHRREKVPLTPVFSTIFMERFNDMLALAFALATVLLFGWLPLTVGEHNMTALSRIFGVMVLLGMAGMLFVALLQERIVSIGSAVIGFFHQGAGQWVQEQSGLLLSGLNPRFYGGVLGKAALLTALGWLLILGAQYASFQAVGLESLTMKHALVFMVTTTFSMIVPNTPGYVGTFHVLAVETLAVYGIPPEQGLAVAIISHSSWYFLETFLGVAFLWQMGVSVEELRKEAEELGEAA